MKKENRNSLLIGKSLIPEEKKIEIKMANKTA